MQFSFFNSQFSILSCSCPGLRWLTLLLALSCGCDRSQPQPPPAPPPAQQTPPFSASDVAPLFGAARNVLAGVKPTAATTPAATPGDKPLQLRMRQVFLSLYGAEGPPLITAAQGSDEALALIHEAANRAAKNPRFTKEGFSKLDRVRLKLDLVVYRWPIMSNPGRPPTFGRDPTRYGLSIHFRESQAHLLPVELAASVSRPRQKPHRMLEAASLRAKRSRDAWRKETCSAFRFIARSFVEAEPGGRAVELFRCMPLSVDLSPDTLARACRMGAEWLTRVQRPDGAFRYIYVADTDSFRKKELNIVRHAGTAYALLRMARVLDDDDLRGAGRGAIEYLIRQLQPVPGYDDTCCVFYNDKAKLGAAALAVVAMLELRGDDMDPILDRWIRALAEFLLMMQRADGSFHSRYDLAARAPDDSFVSVYYPGEATLALVGLYNCFREERFLAAALSSANYLAGGRDRPRSAGEPTQDHWLLLALGSLEAPPPPHVLDYALRIADTMVAHQFTLERNAPLDYVGGKDNSMPPRVTPTATNTEGLTAAYRLAQRAGRDTERYWQTIKRAAVFQLRHQYTTVSSFMLPSPEHAVGAFRSSVLDPTVRIDYVQHNISALWDVARIMKERQRKPAESLGAE